ncbi:MAG: TonB-dependent receptor [Rubrivivax sp.]|nr:TonB-dependent receptor [Rubrivivax sp.]
MKNPNVWPGCALSTISLAVLALAQPAFAQSDQRIEVTGSLIKRLADEGALPVTTVRAEQLEARGHTELKDFMLELPQASSLGSFAGTAGPMTSLRGFGPMRTLTLLNGRRLAKEPLTNQYVSVNVMPRMALSRTDILRDGASSAYGSDAIAGVQAFYTRRNFEGLNIKAEALEPSRDGGGDYRSLGLIGGVGNLASQGWNFYGAVEYQKRKILLREDRPELNTGLAQLGINTTAQGVNATPANFTDPTNPVSANRTLRWNPYFASGCLAPYSEPSTVSGRQTCWLDSNDTYTAFNNGNDILTVYGKGSLALGAHQLSLEYNLGKYTVLQNNPATPVTVRLTNSHPYYPGNGIVPALAAANLNGRPIDALWSVADTGPRERNDGHSNQRVMATLEGELGRWNYQAAVHHGWSERETRAGKGWNSVTGVATVQGTATTLFLDPRLNPFGLQDAAGLAVLRATSLEGRTLRVHRATNTSIDATINGSVFKLGGGDAVLAAGAEFRKDGWQAIGLESNDPKAALNNQIDILGGDGQAAGARANSSNKISRDITSVFAELEMPFTKTLTANAALRADSYKDLNETSVNPKLALRWQPMKELVFRGSANTGFRAPALPEIYSRETERTLIPTFNDPFLCPSGGAVATTAAGYTAAQVCNLTGRNQITKVPGNAQVGPEKSTSFTLGLAFEPVRGVSASLDYWETEIKNIIGNRSITFILNNASLYTSLFRREADGTLSTDAVFNPPSNLGSVRGAGIDLSLLATLPQTDVGRFTLGLDVAYLTRWEAKTPEVNGGDWVSALGFYNDVVPVNPNAGLSNATRGLNHRWRHTASVAWARGDWGLQLSQRYQSKVADQNLAARTGAGTTGPRAVASYEQYNLVGTWQATKQLKLSMAVNNLTDRTPPLTNHNGYLGYLTSSVDVLGRAYRVTMDYKF